MFTYAPSGLLKDHLRRPGAGETVVIENVTIVSDPAASREGLRRVVIRDGRIDEVGPADGANPAAADGVTTIDGEGGFLLPGFIDCHVHLTGLETRDPFRRNIQPFPSVRLIRAVRDAGRVLRAGFTTVRHLGHGDPDQTQAVKEAIASGLVAGPRMLTCGWAMSQTGGHGKLDPWPLDLVEHLLPRSAFVDGPDACRKFVRRQLGDGAEWIKIYTTEGLVSAPEGKIDIPNYTLAEIEAITDEAHRRGARVAAHATGLTGAMNAVIGGADTLEHGPHAPDDELLRRMKESGTVLVPTLSVFESAAEGDIEGLPAFAATRAAGWLAGRRAMVLRAVDEGIPVAVGTDTGGPPHGGLNAREILALTRAGLGAERAIASATADGARAIGLDGEIGRVAEGQWADLVLWTRDPVADPAVLMDQDAIRLVIQASATGRAA